MDMLSALFLLLAVVIGSQVFLALRRRWVQAQRLAWLGQWSLPPSVYRHLAKQRPDLDTQALRLVETALKQWFHCCAHAGRRTLAMPSRVVDDCWHAFILHTNDYADFCTRAFGDFLHHQPWDTQRNGDRAAWRRVWYRSCQEEGINPERPRRLPLLFAIDAQLSIVGGHYFSLSKEAGCYRLWRQGERSAGGDGGATGGGTATAQESRDTLLDLYDDNNNGGCGSGCASSGSTSDGGSAGSSCGGGCGGGD